MADPPPFSLTLIKRILRPLICFTNDSELRIILTISNCLAFGTLCFGLLTLGGIYLEVEYSVATIYHDHLFPGFVLCAILTLLGILMTATFYTMFLIFLLLGLSWMVMAIVGYPPYRLLWSVLKAIHRKRLKVRQQLPGEIVTEIVQCLPYEEKIRLAEITRYIYEIVGELMEEALGTLKARLERKNREVTVVKRLISGMEAVINYTGEDDAALGRRVTTRVSGKLDGKALADWLFAAGYLLLVGALIWTAIPYLMNRYQSNTRHNLLLVDPAFDPKVVVVGMGDGAAVRSNNNYSTLIASREDLWRHYELRINQSVAAAHLNTHGGVPPMPRKLYDVWFDEDARYIVGIVLFINNNHNNQPSDSERLWDDVAEFIYDALYTTRKSLPVLVACSRGGNFFNSSNHSVSNLGIRNSIAKRIRMINFLKEEEHWDCGTACDSSTNHVKVTSLEKKLAKLTVVGCVHPYSASKLVVQQWKESITAWYDKYLC